MAHRVAVTYNFKDKTAAEWQALNPILGEQEPGVESDTGWFKLGDGHTHWNDLPHFKPVTPGGPSDVELDAHINSETPHPVYDDGPSLLELYQNAKV